MIIKTHLENETFTQWEAIIESRALIREKGKLPGCNFKSPPKPPNQNLKNNTFIDTKIANVLCDLAFRRNQTQNSEDDRYIRILKKERTNKTREQVDRAL